MNKPLYLFIGPSGSGKTTIAEMLENNYEYIQVRSYTTRKPRYDGEDNHIFVTKEEFEKLGALAAYTYYNGEHYGTTFDQLTACDIYTIDIDGVKYLLEKMPDNNWPIRVLYFNSTVTTRIERMVDRGSSDTEIISRLHNDERYEWYDKLNKIIWTNKYIHRKNVDMYIIDANAEKDAVLEQILYYMNLDKED